MGLYCELFSEEYHSSPVRVRPEEVGLRTVGAEIGEALFIAVPVAFFWAAVSASFVVTSLRQVKECLLLEYNGCELIALHLAGAMLSSPTPA